MSSRGSFPAALLQGLPISTECTLTATIKMGFDSLTFDQHGGGGLKPPEKDRQQENRLKSFHQT